MANGRGGARPGSGPKKGSHNKKTQELIARVQAEGIMPLDVFINDMRYFYNLGENKMRIAESIPPGEEQTKEFHLAVELKAKAQNCARDAAPYLHSKLASIEGNVNITGHEARLAFLK